MESRRGHAKIPGSFVRGAGTVPCESGQYHYGNMFGSGCTLASADRRRLGCGGHAVWGTPQPPGCGTSPRRTYDGRYDGTLSPYAQIPRSHVSYPGSMEAKRVYEGPRYFHVENYKSSEAPEREHPEPKGKYPFQYGAGPYQFSNVLREAPYDGLYNGRKASTAWQMAGAGAGAVLASHAGKSMQRALNREPYSRSRTPQEEARYQQARRGYDQTLEERYGWRPNLYE